MGTSKPRLDYDQIAHLYDQQPYRAKEVDGHLRTFLQETTKAHEQLVLLDMGCGTGNQLIANHAAFPSLAFVGLDLSAGMLAQARDKSDAIRWVHGDSANPPFADESFDYISCQYSLHHVHDRPKMLREAFRILRPGGRFVLSNICPREMQDGLIYRYFPAAYTRDLEDFPANKELIGWLQECGFGRFVVQLDERKHDQSLRDFLAMVQRRDVNSQLMALPDDAYSKGIATLQSELQNDPDKTLVSKVCLLAISVDKPA